MTETTTEFWKIKTLGQLTEQEWESLCDGCGLCCLHKLEDYETGEVSYTNVACRLLDINTCRCSNYKKRKKLVPDCVILKPSDVTKFKWLPKTCAYRLVSEGKDLYHWHPLVSGSDKTVHEFGISVAHKAISERDAGALENHVMEMDDKAL